MSKIDKLEQMISSIKSEIMKLTNLRPGTLSEQYNVCGKKICRCKNEPPEKHGPYLKLAYTRHGKSGTCFIKKEHHEDIRQQVENYKRLKELVDTWVNMEIEISNIKLKLI
jgi:hypothetical protein